MNNPKKVKNRGYAYSTVKAILAADPAHIGVRLGRVCIENDVPVARVASDLGVSRLTVYAWFEGKFFPNPDRVEQINKLLGLYSAKSL